MKNRDESSLLPLIDHELSGRCPPDHPQTADDSSKGKRRSGLSVLLILTEESSLPPTPDVETARLEAMVRERTEMLWEALSELQSTQRELWSAQNETIHSLSVAAEFRDDETSKHIERVSRYSFMLAESLGMDRDRCRIIGVAARMHDIGKIGVPDSIMLKPARLTADEFETMKTHAEIGHDILRSCTSELASVAAEIAWTHHERIDGSGYPRGLAGDAIPIEGRIVAVADVFDALSTDRIYREAYSVPDALGIMLGTRAVHLDPDVLDKFLDNMDQVIRVLEELP